jgi:hypothetical protein
MRSKSQEATVLASRFMALKVVFKIGQRTINSSANSLFVYTQGPDDTRVHP